ncbi:hypothetical protein CA13_46670 [Planctomycetes bacterium CA13]|uniref:Secreted protein n=1 Tax=Novipirellula herctigrandis TaxID=2527986 RepID=A0A5C5Z7D0_9BACT|nr:hypothetical protein CA13_46670 [Planctomycetes bacterium CA13]
MKRNFTRPASAKLVALVALACCPLLACQVGCSDKGENTVIEQPAEAAAAMDEYEANQDAGYDNYGN